MGEGSIAVLLLSHIWPFATPRTAACQAPLFCTISWSLLKFVSIESVMLLNHLILCRPGSPLVFNLSQHQGLFQWVSSLHQVAKVVKLHIQHPSHSVLSMNIQGWVPLGLTGLISIQSKGLSGVFSSTTVWKHQFFGTQPCFWYNPHSWTWLLEKPYLWLYGPVLAKWCLSLSLSFCSP